MQEFTFEPVGNPAKLAVTVTPAKSVGFDVSLIEIDGKVFTAVYERTLPEALRRAAKYIEDQHHYNWKILRS